MKAQKLLETCQFPEKIKPTYDILQEFLCGIDPIINIIEEYTYYVKITGLCINNFSCIFFEDIYPDPNCLITKFCITVCNEKIYKLRFLDKILVLFVYCANEMKLIYKTTLLDKESKSYLYDTRKNKQINSIAINEQKNELYVPIGINFSVFDIMTGILLRSFENSNYGDKYFSDDRNIKLFGEKFIYVSYPKNKYICEMDSSTGELLYEFKIDHQGFFPDTFVIHDDKIFVKNETINNEPTIFHVFDIINKKLVYKFNCCIDENENFENNICSFAIYGEELYISYYYDDNIYIFDLTGKFLRKMKYNYEKYTISDGLCCPNIAAIDNGKMYILYNIANASLIIFK